ncbi:MAG TPA: bifunctional nicotinamidase/pyrazinamidase [Syntrophales bacterium]|nr:bifunctional nicotinamidase/pyrazinamidase [Syntrophales bacterium]HOL59074.1 bifunctional nicotinamidase/pyrazinamidase [Syntrophales bacterium]HPO35417.1 bifunctional nicotinamidase/pyrazinamidase [Syntrophales bacterium]
MKVLIVVDLQRDFIPGGRLPVPKGDEIVSLINGIMDRFDLVVATQDWHPAQHLSFAVHHEGKKPFEKIMLGGLEQTLWPEHCLQGTEGASFAPGFDDRRVEAIFRKGTDPEIDSYSGFFDNARRKSTGLSDYLRGRGAKKVYVCGLAAEYCVLYTALDAIDLGFPTYYIEDATRALSEADFIKAKEVILSKGGKIVKTSTL